MQRRRFLKLISGAAGTVALGSGAMSLLLPAQRVEGQSFGENLAKFVDRLPIPPVINASGHVGGTPLFKVTMRTFRQKLHRDLPPTKLWGYNNIYRGQPSNPVADTR